MFARSHRLIIAKSRTWPLDVLTAAGWRGLHLAGLAGMLKHRTVHPLPRTIARLQSASRGTLVGDDAGSWRISGAVAECVAALLLQSTAAPPAHGIIIPQQPNTPCFGR